MLSDPYRKCVMSNRKATFAKRQRETDLKDHAKQKEGRRLERQNQTRVGKGPEIAWDLQVQVTETNPADALAGPSLVPRDDGVGYSTPEPAAPPTRPESKPE